MYPVKRSAPARYERTFHSGTRARTEHGRRASLAAGSRTRQAERTRATRRKLLDAAKRIFAQDGFEAARLEDIAAGAGYTRAALFTPISRARKTSSLPCSRNGCGSESIPSPSALRRHSDPAEKLAALRTHYAELATDRRLVLISMEFKLFALRHPEAHARLRSRHRRIRASFGELFSEVMGALGKNDSDCLPGGFGLPRRRLARDCCSNICSTLRRCRMSDVRHVLGLFFDSIFQAAPEVSRAAWQAM